MGSRAIWLDALKRFAVPDGELREQFSDRDPESEYSWHQTPPASDSIRAISAITR
jgi:hypothetical protein